MHQKSSETTQEENMEKRYVYTEKGAAAAKSHGAKAGDPYERPVSKTALKQYVKAGYIAEAK